MEKGSISIYFVHSALEPVLARGLDSDELIRQAGISPALLQSPHSRVTAQNFSALWLGIVRALDDELFGQDSRRMKAGTFGMLCRTVTNCGTLRSALMCMTRFFNLILDDFRCDFSSDGRHGKLTIAGPTGSHILGYETLLMMQHGVACWLIGRRIPILAAAFAYSEPPRSAEYARMYCANLQFNAASTSLRFDHAYLDLPIIQNARTVKEFLQVAPANILLKYKNTSGLSAQIRRRLRGAVRTEWPDFDALAALLNMTASTLRRRLADDGHSFQEIKDQLRRDLAIEYLCHTDKSVLQISDELGFAEASAFHRAFKKWTGSRPGEYRLRAYSS